VETAAPAPAATEAIVHIVTIPASAHVFVGGSDWGTTPIDVRLPRTQNPIALEVRKPGYATLAEKVVPDEDQRLVLTLSPAAAPRRAGASDSVPKSAAPAAPAAPATDGFSRFE
jgi:hypothetical protein